MPEPEQAALLLTCMMDLRKLDQLAAPEDALLLSVYVLEYRLSPAK